MKQAAIRGKDEVYNPSALRGPAPRLFNEWAGLQFLSEVCSEPLPSPRFYGGSRDAGFIVMEDFGAETRLDHALLGTDAAAAEKTMIALSETVGRMHAQTIGKQARYNEIRAALGPTPKIAAFREINSRHIDLLRQTFKAIGVKPRRGFYKEVETVRKTLAASEPFTAYIHSDPCPDNCHWVGSDLRLLDFEGGRYGHALRDGVYPRIHFPTCWCVNRIPEEIARKAEAAYRAALAQGCPEAMNDEIFYPTVVSLCAYWVFRGFGNQMIRWGLLEKDEKWGISTVRQRNLVRFKLLAESAEAFGYLQAIGATARDVLAKLRMLWPDVEDMPYYPAFR
jgi:hypothetical protein